MKKSHTSTLKAHNFAIAVFFLRVKAHNQIGSHLEIIQNFISPQISKIKFPKNDLC